VKTILKNRINDNKKEENRKKVVTKQVLNPKNLPKVIPEIKPNIGNIINEKSIKVQKKFDTILDYPHCS